MHTVRFLWLRLSDGNQPPVHYLGWALLADLPVTFAIALLLNRLTGTSWPEFPSDSLVRVFLAMCLFAPVVETIGMAFVIRMLRRFMKRTEYVPLVTASICAGLHSLAKPLWGIEIFWAFLVFSLCYVAWEKKTVWRALGMTVLLHTLHNLLPLLLLLAARN